MRVGGVVLITWVSERDFVLLFLPTEPCCLSEILIRKFSMLTIISLKGQVLDDYIRHRRPSSGVFCSSMNVRCNDTSKEIGQCLFFRRLLTTRWILDVTDLDCCYRLD